jgi:hypothetical protein
MAHAKADDLDQGSIQIHVGRSGEQAVPLHVPPCSSPAEGDEGGPLEAGSWELTADT